ncbi:MAG TPA: ATP-grasp domain-containing protein [Blastocatellia bacterium]|nr:ATP-grasp domain-containing protein [Blastocatellia bacterium]
MKNSILFLEPKGTMLEVIRAAKGREFTVFALVSDYSLLDALPSPYASARQCIDELLVVKDWNDLPTILSVAQALHASCPVKGVFFGLDLCAVAGAALREYFDLPTPTPGTMELIVDKHKLRTKLYKAGLSKLRSVPGVEADRWTEWKIGRPAYFKPVHGAFSLYVTRCGSLADLQRAKTAWLDGMGSMPKFLSDFIYAKAEYHLEEEFEGELMSVEGISTRGEYLCLGLTSRIMYSKNPAVEMGSCFPYPHPLADAIIDFTRAMHAGLGFTDGPSHVEIMVNAAGEMEVIDFNPRFIGADVLQSINFAYGLKVEELLLDWCVGHKPVLVPREANYSCIQYVLPPHELLLESLDFPQMPEVKFSTSFVKPGMQVSGADRQIDYLGCYLTVMPTYESAMARSKELRHLVTINTTIQGAF